MDCFAYACNDEANKKIYIKMKIIGLSGGIASGKNLISEIFATKGAVIFDADKEVHEI